jgi:uncharacterized protein
VYMAFGGIPYYLEMLNKGWSAAQNIEKICFVNEAPLKNEFKFIFQSLFGKDTIHSKLLKALHTLGTRAKREQLLKVLGINSSGYFTTALWELQESGFIDTATEYNTRSAKVYYFISDYYTHFYLQFIAKVTKYEKGIWTSRLNSQAVVVWQGLAFEKLCVQHIAAIKKELQIDGVFSKTSTILSAATKKHTQIDIVLDRDDKVINIIECKFYSQPFTITKAYDLNLRKKIATFQAAYPSRKSVWLVMLATFGITLNAYSKSIVQNELTLDTLFTE